MATYTENGITFTRVILPSFVTSGRMAYGTYTIDGNNNITSIPSKMANCIDIDLNDADMGNNTYLATFADLINYILALEARIQTLENNT